MSDSSSGALRGAGRTSRRLRPVYALSRVLLRVFRWLDGRRIAAHLRRAERDLRRTDVSHLSQAERLRRERLLDALRSYWQRGRFPTNETARERTPCFVGANGVPCAVAYLLLVDGRGDLVEQIADRDNTIRLERLDAGAQSGHGSLVDWLEHNGLSSEEAARIQPSYPGGYYYVTDCGPISCATARLAVLALSAALFLVLEYVGYRFVDDLFPENALKRRSALAYVTVLNALVAPLVGVLTLVLLP